MPHQEQQYLDLIRRVINIGHYRPSPHEPLPGQGENPGTFTLINQNMAFDLSEGEFPLVTVRQTPFKMIARELLWFLSGSTDNRDLQAMGANIWDPWDSPDTNQSMGWSPGQLGPIYGKQWRHWGARMIKPYGQLAPPVGYDQIRALIDQLKTTPHSKRMFVTSYDPSDARDCFVTTCHGLFFCQVWDDQLNLHMVQRSGDLPVGIPFNIASYALLLRMLAQVTGYQPGTLHITISDAHVYENQIPAMEMMLRREPLTPPELRIDPNVTDIFGFSVDDFTVMGYKCHPKLEVPVAV